MGKFRKLFRQLPDPRAANARHDLLEVLFIALAAVLCGAESCSDMADFGQSKEGLLRLFLRLEHGVPSHDTFSRVFRLLKPQAFEFAFRQFMAGFAKANGLKLTGVVAIDGKALRGAYERGGRANPLHLVNVFAVDARMALASRKRPVATRRGVLWKCWICCASTGASSLPMRSIATAPLPTRYSSAAAIMFWRSKPTGGPCSQLSPNSLRDRASAAPPSRSTSPLTTAAKRDARPSCVTPAWLQFIGFLVLQRWAGSPRGDACRTKAPGRLSFATFSCPNTCRLRGCCTSPAVTGPSRTSSIGCLTSISPRIAIGRGRTMLPRTSPFCAGSPSTSCEPTPTPHPYGAKSNAPAGTMPSSWKPSAICDSPAASGAR